MYVRYVLTKDLVSEKPYLFIVVCVGESSNNTLCISHRTDGARLNETENKREREREREKERKEEEEEEKRQKGADNDGSPGFAKHDHNLSLMLQMLTVAVHSCLEHIPRTVGNNS
jgi:hypothetical protein